ncbi:MAG: hypothetical protein ACK562_11540 [Acidobacteriota bacterium]|jgi:hypothetical protein
MVGSKSDREKNIDRLIGTLVKAHSARNQAASRATSGATPEAGSPFLAQRIMARIEAEKRRRAEEGSAWGILFREGLQVIPFLTLIAIFIMGLAVSTQSSDLPIHQSTVPATPHALTAGDIAPFSDDERLAWATGSDDRKTK